MTNIDASARKPHQGRNIKRFREIFGIKQEALALELGDDWSQKKVSRMEENEEIDDGILEQVAKILRVCTTICFFYKFKYAILTSIRTWYF